MQPACRGWALARGLDGVALQEEKELPQKMACEKGQLETTKALWSWDGARMWAARETFLFALNWQVGGGEGLGSYQMQPP